MKKRQLKIEKSVCNIVVSQHIQPIVLPLREYKVQELQKQIMKLQQQILLMQLSLRKVSEVNFIMKGYFGKVQKIIYNKQSHLFDQNPIDYQKIQLHMRELLRRLNDIHNEKLNSIPLIYRKNNVKIYRQTVEKSRQQK